MYLAGGQPVAVAPTSPLPSLPVIPLVAATEVEATEPADTVGDSALDLDLDLDFSLDEPEPVDVAEPAAPVLPVMAGNSLPELEAVSASSEPVAATVAPTVASTPSDMLEFDFDSLSLDLDDSDVVPTKQPPLASADALKSKLTLAEEFKASGDEEGARELIQQVINEADGPLKARAQQALSQF
jgi:pilus assembly protein FimV